MKKPFQLTVGELLDYIQEHNVSRDAFIYNRRIEDWYFKEGGWKPVKKEGEHYHMAVQQNEDVANGIFNDREQYPLITDEWLQKTVSSEEDLERLKEDYYQCTQPILFKDDSNLYLDGHF